MYNPVLLERLIDDYWCQDKDFLTAVLTKEEEIEIRVD